MNYKVVLNNIGNILKLEAVLLLLPLFISLRYREGTYIYFLIPIAIALGIGFLLTIKKPDKKEYYAKEGLLIVGISWIVLSLIGCLPFFLSKEIPNYIDALFEIVSGFTTTGASILTQVEGTLSKGMLFWRSFSHWIGGMGIIVFILAFMPSSGRSIHILRAESPGPQVGKIVSKVKLSARILYVIYICLTILQIILLLCGGMHWFDAVTMSFGTAGTGGFTIRNNNFAEYSTYSQVVTTIFMFLFGMNFNVFFFLLIGSFRQALKCEEVYWYFGIAGVSIVVIACNLIFGSNNGLSVGTNIKDAAFQVVSIMTTTGFATADFTQWPVLSQIILFILIFVGACASSTGGGLKVSRIAIMIKNMFRQIKQLIRPNSVNNIRFEGQKIDDSLSKSVTTYFSSIMIIFVIVTLIVSIDNKDFITTITAAATCLNNVGPGLGEVGPFGNFAGFSPLSKLTLTLAMLIGRLEIFPILVLFAPSTWKKI